MAPVQQRVLNWLYSVLTSEYKDVNRTYNDVAQTLTHYTSLTPRTEVFTYENGISALLLHISGTLPVTFRGTTYRFPISVWIPHAYPREAPLIYVTPTETMVVRAGQHVDPQGKVYHPYLVGWAEFWDKSNILDFMAILREVFAKEPPVISRQQHNIAQSPQPSIAPPPRPPLPPGQSSTSAAPSSSQYGQTASPPPPPPPPKESRTSSQNGLNMRDLGPALPPQSAQPPQQNLQPDYANRHQPTRQSSLRYQSGPPLPPQPSQQLPRPTLYNQQQGPPPRQQYVSQQPPQNLPPNSQYPPGPSLPQRLPSSQYPPSYSGPPNQPPPFQQHPQQPYPPPQAPPQKKPPPPDLLDAPLILPTPTSGPPLPAPSIPPNPEKDLILHNLAIALHSYRTSTRTQSNSSLPGLSAQNAALRTAYGNITSEIAQLENLTALLTTNTSILHSALLKADAVIENSATRAPPGVDEILVAPTVVGQQLYSVVCEERALADAVFVLSRAVERGRVGPAVFVKQTRGLGREWFLKKALGRKIARGMGLEMDAGRSYGR